MNKLFFAKGLSHYDAVMQASEATITVLDFESTGSVKGWPTEPWQIAMTRLVDGRVQPAQQLDRFLHVGDRPFHQHAPGRHAEVRQQLNVAPRLPDLWAELKPWLVGCPLAAHNPPTEKGFLRSAAPLHRFGPWLDTLKLTRIAYPDLPSHALEDITRDLELDERLRAACPGREAHDALYDAVACALLLEHLIHLPGWEKLSVDYLAEVKASGFYRRRKKARPSS